MIRVSERPCLRLKQCSYVEGNVFRIRLTGPTSFLKCKSLILHRTETSFCRLSHRTATLSPLVTLRIDLLPVFMDDYIRQQSFTYVLWSVWRRAINWHIYKRKTPRLQQEAHFRTAVACANEGMGKIQASTDSKVSTCRSTTDRDSIFSYFLSSFSYSCPPPFFFFFFFHAWRLLILYYREGPLNSFAGWTAEIVRKTTSENSECWQTLRSL